MARKITVQPAAGPTAEINITPLVDVVLVLLIIFMVLTPLLEKDIGVRVPATEQVQQRDEVPPDQIVVRLDTAGEVSINGERVPRAGYVDRLSGILSRRRAADRLVFVVADDAAGYGELVGVIDGAKLAGAETIGMATSIPEGAASTRPDAPRSPP